MSDKNIFEKVGEDTVKGCATASFWLGAAAVMLLTLLFMLIFKIH